MTQVGFSQIRIKLHMFKNVFMKEKPIDISQLNQSFNYLIFIFLI